MPKTTLEGLLPPELRKDLTPAEKILLDKARQGEPADFKSDDEETDKPENADNWGDDRRIRADLLYWLCVDREASECVHAKGIRIDSAKVEGQLDFEAATLPHPLRLTHCAIPEGIILRGAQTRTIMLSDSHTGPIDADRLTTQGDVLLRGTQTKGAVHLLGADIKGSLDCTNATFDNPKGMALVADGLTTQGGVFLGGSQAKGEVRLLGANIGGDLVCEGASFENPKGTALRVDRLTTQGSVFLGGSQAKGEVSLLGANIGGELDCEGASFENPKGDTLSADRLIIQGSVFLRNGFQAKGVVRLLGANIGGILEWTGATFENPEGYALAAERLLVKGGLFCRSMEKRPVGIINLVHANVGPLVDDMESWPQEGNLRLEGFEYEAFAGDSPQTATDRLHWLALQPQKPFHPQPYEQLAKVFRRMGREVDALEVLIAKQETLRKYGELSRRSKVWKWFLGWTIAHGYKPWRVLWWIMVPMIVIGSGVFSWAYDLQIINEVKESAPPFSPFIYSLEVFVPLVDLHQESYYLPNAEGSYGAWVRVYFWAHIALGWISSTLLVAALTGLVRKE